MYEVIVQRAVSNFPIPHNAKLKRWVQAVLQDKIPSAEMTIRIVDKEEIQQLNATYRHKNKPTNVLAFPSELPTTVEMDLPLLGDLVICAEIIAEEAKEQYKELDAHWAHMVVHGLLHLQGYDHVNDVDANIMESEEILILKKLGFDNPYQIREKRNEQ